MSEKTPWHEDDALWQGLGPLIFSRAIAESTETQVDRIIERLSITAGVHLLDLC